MIKLKKLNSSYLNNVYFLLLSDPDKLGGVTISFFLRHDYLSIWRVTITIEYKRNIK
uniref:Uncharacterized protein n=1 Tax=Lepeophtheirus salmonis TaxID=72036 RepID=A0A0K2VG28_LEPSM